MTKITFSTRPADHPERTTVVKFVDGLNAKILTEAGLLKLRGFRTASTAYAKARATNQGAAATADTCRTAASKASIAFQPAFRRWANSVDDANQEGYAEKTLPPHLGDKSVSRFFVSDDRFQVDKMGELFAYIELNPALAGSDEKLQALKDATTTFDEAVTASEAAIRARATASEKLVTATAAFDRAWGKLVKELQDGDPTLASEIPKFRRESGASKPVPPPETSKPAEAESTEAEEVEEAEPAEVEEPEPAETS